MATKTKTAKPKPGSSGSGLTRKAGPLPVYAWALLAIGAYLLWNRGRSQGSGSSSGAGQTDAAGVNQDDLASLRDSFSTLLEQNQAGLQSLSDQIASSQGGSSMSSNGSAGYTGSGGGGGGIDAFGNPLPPGHTDTFNYEWYYSKVLGWSPSQVWAEEDARKRTGVAGQGGGSDTTGGGPSTGGGAATRATRNTAPFGGVVRVRKLANGATLRIYASGREVEQVPGKTAYVVKA